LNDVQIEIICQPIPIQRKSQNISSLLNHLREQDSAFVNKNQWYVIHLLRRMNHRSKSKAILDDVEHREHRTWCYWNNRHPRKSVYFSNEELLGFDRTENDGGGSVRVSWINARSKHSISLKIKTSKWF